MNGKRNVLFELANEQAAHYHSEYPEIFGRVPVRVSALLKHLRIGVRVDPYLQDDGVVERFREDVTRFSIRIRADLSPNRGRFVLAHELGHVILLNEHEGLANRWDLRTREKFANVFARELLLPNPLRASLREEFRSVTTALAYLRLMDGWGIHPVAGIRFLANHSEWMENNPTLFLNVAYAANRFTGREERLRVIAAAFDRERFYIATNQSFQRISSDDSWLSILLPGDESFYSDIKLQLNTRMHQGNLRYQLVQYSARITALRLTSHRGTSRGSFLLAIEPATNLSIKPQAV
jgi:hypothetical protein